MKLKLFLMTVLSQKLSDDLNDLEGLTPNHILQLRSVTVHGFPVPSSLCLMCVHVCVCEQVSVGVCD